MDEPRSSCADENLEKILEEELVNHSKQDEENKD
jgi:hypothetical protein